LTYAETVQHPKRPGETLNSRSLPGHHHLVIAELFQVVQVSRTARRVLHRAEVIEPAFVSARSSSSGSNIVRRTISQLADEPVEAHCLLQTLLWGLRAIA
jgi:hypothetical protein